MREQKPALSRWGWSILESDRRIPGRLAGKIGVIVCVSSVAHAGMRGVYGEIDFDDLNFDRREYDAYQAYANPNWQMYSMLWTLGVAWKEQASQLIQCIRAGFARILL